MEASAALCKRMMTSVQSYFGERVVIPLGLQEGKSLRVVISLYMVCLVSYIYFCMMILSTELFMSNSLTYYHFVSIAVRESMHDLSRLHV